MMRLALLTVCVLQIVLAISATGQYSVIGPGTIHPGRKYNVAVAVHHVTEPVKIKVGITGPLYNETKTLDLQAGEVKDVEFDVPNVEKGDYNLTAEGLSGIEFKKNSTKLNFNVFKPHVKIETDKGIYKPGDDVNFRLIFLDENLRPAIPDEKTVAVIEDDKRNRLKEYKNLKVVKGVHTGKFHISEYASLGNWYLVVENADSYPQTAYFSVSKYVPPKYNVNVKATENVSVKDGDMQVVVRSNYTYGKPVNAKVTFVVQMTPSYNEDNELKESPPSIIRTADMVNGKAKLDLNVKQYENFMPYKTSATYLEITATVEENFTGVKLNSTTSTALYPFRYLMNCVSYETCSSFEADKKFDVIFQITYVDGTHISDTKSVVKLRFAEQLKKVSWWRGMKEVQSIEEPKIEKRVYEFEGNMNQTGHVTFTVALPDLEEFEGFDHFFDKELEYKDEKRSIYRHYQYRKPKQIDVPVKEPTDYFKIHTNLEEDTYNTKIGKETILTLNSSEPIPYFVYNIVGRGNILESKRVDLPDKPKVYNLTIIPTFDMAPHGAFYVYYVDEQGELHYAETTFYVKVELQNKIELTVPEQVKPGTDVDLHIKTTPNSFVGIVAVDQSVLELRDGNYVSKSDFDWRLGSYSTHTPWQGGYSHYPGSHVGVITLTNADYFYNWTNPYVPEIGGAQEISSASLGRSALTKTTTLMYDSIPMPQAEAGLRSAAAPGGSGGGAVAPVRKDFSETWIFANIENVETDEFVWTKKIPDTITKWVINAFSLHPTKGLGVIDERTHITTFQPFFVSIRLPYSVKRGEVINVPALVFNYLEKDLDVKVTLDNMDGEYDFIEVSNEVINEQLRTKTVRVPAISSAGVSFMIRPKRIGNILLKFTAESPIAADAVHKTLKVVPEGITEYANRAYFVNLKDTPEFQTTFDLALPNEIVKDSQHVEFGVVGDLLGPIFMHLNSLLRVPMGCGEQTTSKLVPNSIVLQYLKTADKLTPALEREIKNNLETGYQHILNFQHKDGSFSSFGYALRHGVEVNGSTWLTAYVMRSLRHAKQHINVDEKILHKGLKYLVGKQAQNGTFLENGDYFFAGQSQHLSLTASVVLALFENKDLAAEYQTNIDRGIKYIVENIENSENLRDKAIATYVLQRTKHSAAPKNIAALKALAKTEDDRMWWSSTERPQHIWWRWSFSNDVEITSYILLTLLDSDTENVDSVLPIVRWLVSQRNSYGGFTSTQDTVMGLQALVKFIEKSGYKPAVMSIDLTAKGDENTKTDVVTINEENSLLLQKLELPEKTTSITFNAKGHGAALVQISYQYNIVEHDKTPSFSIKTLINKDTPERKLEMDVCVEYQDEGPSSNMAIVEVTLPSGYIVDADALHLLEEVDRVRHVETKNSESVIVVYFESLRKKDPKCLTINALKVFAVALQKPSSIVAYDYYDTERRNTAYYNVASKMCDICEDDEECKKACS